MRRTRGYRAHQRWRHVRRRLQWVQTFRSGWGAKYADQPHRLDKLHFSCSCAYCKAACYERVVARRELERIRQGRDPSGRVGVDV